MSTSAIYLGADRTLEQRLRHSVGVDIAKLHTLAQRASWGIMLGERAGVDLDQVVERLTAEFGDQFAAHVTAAIVRRHQGRDDDARAHLERARSQVTPDHPWVSLVPAEAHWQAPAAEQTLDEVEAGRVYRVVSENRVEGKAFGNLGVATFLRMRSGELVCINPVQMDERIAARVRELGDVTHILAPAKYHSDFVPLARRLFPGARAFGVAGQRDYPLAANVGFDGFLDDDKPLFPNELDQITMHGVDVGDVWLIDRASRTVLITDSVFLTRRTASDEAFRRPFGAFYSWAWGTADRIAVPSYQPAMWQNLPSFQASLRRALEHDFDHAGSCHGPWHVLENDARAELGRSLAWLLELSPLQGLGHLGGFVRRHPGIFMRLVREQIAAKLG